jgi:predicted amidohydrolase
MKQTFTIALAQTMGDPDPRKNIDTARHRTGEAAQRGARLVVFPEMFMALPRKGAPLSEAAEPLDGPFASALADLAREHGLWLAAGLWERIPGSDRVYNVAVLISPQGKRMTAYRKLHLFDALSIRESDRMAPGDALPEIVEAEGFRIGLTICYDLRFPELFRHLSDRGADLILVPSAWYAGPLKEEHWLTLLKARAIENTCYIAGANMAGGPFSARSAVIDPFGVVVADGGEAPGLVFAGIDPERIGAVREKLPALNHRRRELLA